MKTLWCKNQENPSDRISHTWAPLTILVCDRELTLFYTGAVIRDCSAYLTCPSLQETDCPFVTPVDRYGTFVPVQ